MNDVVLLIDSLGPRAWDGIVCYGRKRVVTSSLGRGKRFQGFGNISAPSALLSTGIAIALVGFSMGSHGLPVGVSPALRQRH